MRYAFVRQLLELAESFEEQQREGALLEIPDFAAWLATKTMTKPVPASMPEVNLPAGRAFTGMQISRLLAICFRHARHYARQGIANTTLVTMDDFIYLAELRESGPMTKTALIERNVHEKPTGMEIINRLVRQGLVDQYPNPDDRRSKKLRLTDGGLNLLGELVGRMHGVAESVTADLTDAELLALLHLLNKLHTFHYAILYESPDKVSSDDALSQ